MMMMMMMIIIIIIIMLMIINSAIETVLLNKQRLKITLTLEMVMKVCSYGVGQELQVKPK